LRLLPLTGFKDWKESDMPNKINELAGNTPGAAASLGAPRTPGAVAASSSSTPAEAAGAAGDVHITDTASFLASLEPALREAPAVDAAKVAAIRTAIEQGQYTVQPEQVATQLMHIERALGELRGSAQPAAAITPAAEEKR
jgi:negative regulator of flagellin synthesis FlgM